MKKLLTILLLSFALFANAQTYYISPSGNDANNGTQASPWKTLSKAVATVKTFGDIIHVNAGSFTVSTQLNLAIGVSIEGEGVTSIIVSNYGGGEFLSLASPQRTNGNQHISNLKIDGNNLAGYAGIKIEGRSNVSIYNCTIINFRENGVIFAGIDQVDPGKDPVGLHATGNSFHDNIMTNCSRVNPGYASGCLMYGGQDGMLVYNNTITQTQRGAFGNGWPIKYWNDGWLRGCKIYNNVLTKGPYGGTYPGENGAWDFAMEFFNVQGMEIYGNTIQGSIDFNYNLKGAYPYSIYIHDNTLSHPVQNPKVEGSIIFEYRTETAIVENNIITNKTYGISFNTRGYNDYGGDNLPNPGGTPAGGYSYIDNCIIRNNLFKNLYDASGIGNRFGVGVISENTNDPQINNLQIINNTFIGKAGNATYLGLDFTSQENGKITGLIVKDNIFQGLAFGAVSGRAAKTQSGVSITGNAYWQTAAPSWTGATITGNTSVNPNLDANGVSALAIGYKPSGTVTPPPACTSWVFGPWSDCNNGISIRALLSSLPAGCVGNPPADSLTKQCTIVINPPPPPVNDTTYCTVIQYGSNLTRRAVQYFVKRADGFTYDNTGVRRDNIWLFKAISGKWYRKDFVDGKWYLLF